MPKPRVDETDFQIRFYENILKEKEDFIEALIAIGDLYTKKGLYQQGLEVDRKLSRLRPEDPHVLYNLACSYSLVQNAEKALGAIKLALECGYDDFYYLEQDEDLSYLRKDERFQEYLYHFRNGIASRNSR